MDIVLQEKTIREVCNGYSDKADNGVVAFGGKLNVRPAYQREFIYDDKKRNAVIDTILKGFPLNVMYWVENDDGSYEMLDGQQRTISFCQYVNGDFSVNSRAFHNLTDTEQKQILDYKLMIYVCKGNDKEKLDWFKIINIPSMQLTAQELRNAIYTGPWLSDAKKYFSKSQSPAAKIGGDYLKGEANRQAFLETAIHWIASKENKSIEDYMGAHQHDTNASALWLYFQSVINWVNTIFPTYRKEMKSIEWGILFNQYGAASYDPTKLENQIKELMIDDDVTAKKGIYEYLLSGQEKHLSIRSFTEAMKREAFERQNGVCPHCVKDNFQKKVYTIAEMEADHITPWCEGGKTIAENCQMLCQYHNRHKSSN